MEEMLEELVEQLPEELVELETEAVQAPEQLSDVPEMAVEDVAEEAPVEVPAVDERLETMAQTLAAYGGSGNVETVDVELETVMEGLLEAQAVEVERSRKAGMLTFALSQIVHDPGAVMALVNMDEMDFDLSNMVDLRDFLEPVYQEKPYLFKVISPLRGANVASGMMGQAVPSNGELGTLTMEEYTAYRNARGSVSR